MIWKRKKKACRLYRGFDQARVRDKEGGGATLTIRRYRHWGPTTHYDSRETAKAEGERVLFLV